MRFLIFCLIGVVHVYGQEALSCLTALGAQGECIEWAECLRRATEPLVSLGVNQCNPSAPGDDLYCCPLEGPDETSCTEEKANQILSWKHTMFRPPIKLDRPGKPLDDADFNLAHTISLTQPNFTQHNPMKVPGLLEGDIVPQFTYSENRRQARAIIKRRSKLWKKALVPYVISSTFDDPSRAIIARAIMEFEQSTCLRFIPRTKERDFIAIVEGDGCYSNVGRRGGRQEVSLGPGCIHLPIVLHELMHAVGIFHEHSRADRDKYIKIAFNNVENDVCADFFKFGRKEAKNFKTPYDMGSLMHYGAFHFSKNGNPTIFVKNGKGLVVNFEMGKGFTFSQGDIKGLNLLYKCPKD